MALTVGPRHVGGGTREARLAALPLLPEVASIRVTGRRGYHSSLQAVATLISALLVTGVFAGSWMYMRWASTLDPKITTPTALLPPQDLAVYQQAARAAATPCGVGR